MNDITVSQAKFSDFEALQDAVQDSPTDIVQTERGKMSGELMHLSVGSVGVSYGRFTRGVRQSGVLSKHRWVFVVRLGSALMRGFEMMPGDLFILPPGQEFYARYCGADNRYAAILVEPDELFAFLKPYPGAQDAAVWRQSASLLTGDPAIAAARSQILRSLLEPIVGGATMPAEMVEAVKRELLTQIIAPVLDGVEYREPRLPLSAAKLVNEVDHYLVETGGKFRHISELSERFNVSRRSLHRAFKDELGIGPITFMRRKRLGDVHTVLLRGGPDLIKKVAIEHGFLDLSKFAREYQRLFGERPSETLRRGQR